MTTGKRDANRKVVIIGVSSVDETTPIPITVDPDTGRLRVKVAGNSGENGIPDREQARRDANRIVDLLAETNDSDRTITPLSMETANDGLMFQGS